ncbi:MAG: hypothetical protein AAF600_07015 [Bacteroidota bacterium]
MKKIVLPLFILISVSFACDDDQTEVSCGPYAITSEDYENIQSDPFSISSSEIIDNCLSIEIITGGCDGESWTAQLYKSEAETFSLPPQLFMKLVLNDDEYCEAAIKKTFQFDLTPIIDQREQFIIRLEGWDQLLEYPTFDTTNILGNWNLTNINGGLLGTDIRFSRGEIIWKFGKEKVEIQNNIGNETVGIMENGTYDYSITKSNNHRNYYELEIGELNMGPIIHLTVDSLVIDQRVVDGLQYVLIR